MRRWKIMFDRHGDVLRCEQLDGPLPEDGQELMVVEERELRGPRPEGGSSPAPEAPRRPTLPGGDSLEPAHAELLDDATEATRQREPVTV